MWNLVLHLLRETRQPSGWRRRFMLCFAMLAHAVLFSTAQAQLPPALQSAWSATGLPESALSLVIEEVGGQRLASHHAELARNPASVMKLVTSWAALDALGPAYTWDTKFFIDAAGGIGADGALNGPLYLKASGDPAFRLEDLWLTLRELRLRNIRIVPELVVDRSIFGRVGIDPGAFDGEGMRPYNASPDAWVVSFGAIRLMAEPDFDQQVWRVKMDPPIPAVRIEGEIGWSGNVCMGPPVVSTESFLAGDGGVIVRLSGQVPASCGPFSLQRVVLDQASHAEQVLRLMWEDLGGALLGRVREGEVPRDALLIHTHQSPTLGTVIRDVNKFSNNLMARHLLLTLGAERGAQPATAQSSAEALIAHLAARRLAMPELVVENGAGLSRFERVSADSLSKLLQAAWLEPTMPDFVSSLAILGVDGTLRRRVRGEVAQGRGRLKSGSLRDVRSMAGYIQGNSGRRYVVVSLINDERAAQANAFHDRLFNWVAMQ